MRPFFLAWLFTIVMASAALGDQSGCAAASNSMGGFGTPVRPSRAIPFWARYLAEEPLLQRAMRVSASIYLIDANNAFAEMGGNVYLGTPLYQKMEAELGGQYAFQGGAFIMYHEFGHQFQFRMLRQNYRGGPVRELQADVLGGYWMGARIRQQLPVYGQQEAQRAIANGLEAAWRVGDYAFDDPQHHGTPDQRKRAIEEGLKAGFAMELGDLNVAFSTREDAMTTWSDQTARRIFGRPDPMGGAGTQSRAKQAGSQFDDVGHALGELMEMTPEWLKGVQGSQVATEPDSTFSRYEKYLVSKGIAGAECTLLITKTAGSDRPPNWSYRCSFTKGDLDEVYDFAKGALERRMEETCHETNSSRENRLRCQTEDRKVSFSLSHVKRAGSAVLFSAGIYVD